MNQITPSQPRLCYYFVDEAGDATLYDKHGKVLVGTTGCSDRFFLGLLDIPDPLRLSDDLDALRKSLLADPYFKGIPSMQPSARKTAFYFHAKDDLPEVRREVYSLLMRHEMKFFAVVRDKRRIEELVRQYRQKKLEYRYHPDQLYDRCVSRLFKERLHKDDGYSIRFAKRGNKTRTMALRKALELARNNFRYFWGIVPNAPIEIIPSSPSSCGGLQAADYFLWALQRLYKRNEDRYWQFVWPSVSLVHDIDYTANKPYGEYYSQRNPLNLSACAKNKPEI